jgi:tetratricopeptide (TPR) repeat protein
MALSQLFMKRKKSHQGFHKRVRGSMARPSLLNSIRNTFQGGDYAGALAAINQAVAGISDVGVQSELLSLAGDCLFRQGKYAEATDAYGRIGNLVQDQPMFWLRPAIGQIHSLLKDVQVEAAQTKALAVMQTAQKFYQQYQTQLVQAQATVAAGGQATIPPEPLQPAKVASRLGNIFFSEGEVLVAKPLFQQAVQLEPNNHKALLGLAEIVLRENHPTVAITHARQALASNHYHAETLSAWPILLAAGRKIGTDVLDASLLNSLSQAPPAVRARSVLLIAKNLRGQGDARWQQIATDWLQSAGTTDKVIAAELHKLMLANVRIVNVSVASRQQLAQALLQTPGISPSEWLAATKQVVATALSLNQAPSLDALVAQGVGSFGAKLGSVFAHGIALACQKAGRADLAAPLFQRNTTDPNASSSQVGKSLWALARVQSSQGNHVKASKSFWNYSQNAAFPQRFRLYALLQYALELFRAQQPQLIEQAAPQLQTALSQISDNEMLLDVARQLRYSQFKQGKVLAENAYQRGRQMALREFDAAGHPATAAAILFKFSRRAFDFARLDDIITTWTRLDETKRQWLWSTASTYWNWQELVLRAYLDSGQLTRADNFGTAILNDLATPPEAIAILGPTYATLKQRQGDFTTMLATCERVVQAAPGNERTAIACYWLALRAWKRGNVVQTKDYAQRMLLALGKNCLLYWKTKYQASAYCLAAGLDLSQMPTQCPVSADNLQSSLQDIQNDLATLPNSV